MNRFQTKDRRERRSPAALIPILLFLVVLFLAVRGFSSIRETTLEKGRESLETALLRSVVQCYAMEGFYPPSLEYLEEHYGLTYDKERYRIDYQPVGSNLMPDMAVLEIH